MKNIFTFLLVLIAVSVLHASDCIVQIKVNPNPNLPNGYTFSTDPLVTDATYLWTFGDNTLSDMAMPTHSYKTAGTYLIQVTVTPKSVAGAATTACTGSLSQVFEAGITPPPLPVLLTGKGKVSKSVTTDVCGLSITLSTGTVLIPVQVVPAFVFKDGQYVEVAYEIHQELTSGCNVGIPVKIVRISEISTVSTCIIPITYVKNTTTPASYTFKTEPQANGAKFLWSFGDKTSLDMAAPTHTFSKADTYVVQLKVTAKDGKICYGELKAQFEGGTVPPPPVILTGKGKVSKTSATDACAVSITLTNGSILIPTVVVPTFEFKDGQYVELAYELVADKPSGCPAGVSAKIDKISEIIVQPVCKVPIISTKSPAAPATYTFTTDPQPAGVKYSWTFGDGGTSDQAAPNYTFKISGTYLINLKITDAAGKVCYGEIKAAFDGLANPKYSGSGKVKKLTSTGCDLAIATNLGTVLIPFSMPADFQLKDGQYVEFTYEKYPQKMSTCNEGTDVKILTIKEIITTPVCKTYFTATNKLWSDPAMMKKMAFTAVSTGDIKECTWTFGDNTTSTEIKPVHEYAAYGEYKVCLQITTKADCKSEYCAAVKVEAAPVVTTCKFDLVSKVKDASALSYSFSTVSQAQIKTWNWTFGDGKTSDLSNPDHAYDKPGVYEVKCVIATAAGCTETRTTKITVVAPVLPNCSGAISILLYDPTDNKCNGKATVKLLDANGSEIANVKYNWTDNSTGSTIENLCQDKTYSVQASVEGVCQKSYSFTFLSKPVWRASTVNGQNNFKVLDPKDGIAYEWDFGNGTILKGAEVNYSFPTDGVYDVKLKAASGADFSELTQQVVVMYNITGTEIINKSEIEVYPNPVKDMLRINFGNPVSGNMVLEILNITGQRTFFQQLDTNGFSQVAVNIQQLKKGIYFLRISNGKLVIADRKFIKAD